MKWVFSLLSLCVLAATGVASAQQRAPIPPQQERETVYSKEMLEAQKIPPVDPAKLNRDARAITRRAMLGEISKHSKCQEFSKKGDALMALRHPDESVVLMALFALRREAVGAGCGFRPQMPQQQLSAAGAKR